MNRLNAIDVKVLDALAAGERQKEIGRQIRRQRTAVKHRMNRIYEKLELETLKDLKKHPRIMLAQWWTSEIFRIGLEELGMLPQNRRAA
jgi:DNA-binding NarL/FixJ family response regulator